MPTEATHRSQKCTLSSSFYSPLLIQIRTHSCVIADISFPKDFSKCSPVSIDSSVISPACSPAETATCLTFLPKLEGNHVSAKTAWSFVWHFLESARLFLRHKQPRPHEPDPALLHLKQSPAPRVSSVTNLPRHQPRPKPIISSPLPSLLQPRP